ncbi:hypothetical protein R3P38DRAFT_3191288 [Favolaschia claudopus]|uniref:Uncharacterized protein n=1 Tax=Favolaschia claudopus TaxID=2862362 RepID=A0AAW0BKX9_9AGAR
MEHVFPHLLTLGVEFYEIRPDFWASLARSSHLEMLIVRGWTWKPVIDNKWKNGRRANVSLPVQLYMAAPSLRILHFHLTSTTRLMTLTHIRTGGSESSCGFISKISISKVEETRIGVPEKMPDMPDSPQIIHDRSAGDKRRALESPAGTPRRPRIRRVAGGMDGMDPGSEI